MATLRCRWNWPIYGLMDTDHKVSKEFHIKVMASAIFINHYTPTTFGIFC